MFIPKETNIEKLVREYVPGFFVSTSILMNRFLSYKDWGGMVFFDKDHTISKKICRNNKVFLHKMSQAIPDFILVDKRQSLLLSKAIENISKGRKFEQPFPKDEKYWYCEIFGDYWHSEEIIGLSRDVHEQEVRAAYNSIGCEVLILWEDEIINHWEDSAKPKLNEFIMRFASRKEVCFNFSCDDAFNYSSDEINGIFNSESLKQFLPEDEDRFWSKCNAQYFKLKELLESNNKLSSEETIEPEEGYSFVKCKLCGGVFRRLGSHLKRIHKQSVEEYQKRFPGASIICKEEQKRISQTNAEKSINGKKKYIKRTAYLLPDGTYTGITHKYKKEWKTDTVNPAHIFDAEKVGYISQDNREFAEGTEGVDFVSCKICGERKGNLTQHLRKVHNISKEDYMKQYDAEIYSQKAKESQHLCALHKWQTQKSINTQK